jgi:hypothetical protein
MYTHPDNAIQLVDDRHRDMHVDVGSFRLARQLRALAAAPRHVQTTPPRLRRAWRPVLRPRADT